MIINVLLRDQFMWSTSLFACLIVFAVIYSWLVHHFTEQKIYHKQPLLFFSGLALLYITLGSPITALSHLSFSLHMIQMSILFFVIPPILILGIPNRLLNTFVHIRAVNLLLKGLRQSRMALFIFATLFLLYHIPVILNAFSQHSFIHNSYLFLLLILSFSMWWPLASPIPEHRFHRRNRKKYVFLSGMLLMPACLLFIFSAFIDGTNNPFMSQLMVHLCIPAETNSLTILPPPFNTKYDQASAGLLMLGIHKLSLMTTGKVGKAKNPPIK